VINELHTLALNVTTELWGPSPLIPEPVRPESRWLSSTKGGTQLFTLASPRGPGSPSLLLGRER